MKKKRSTLFYILIVSGLGAVIYWIIEQGNALQNPALTAQQITQAKDTATTNSFHVFTDSFNHNLSEPLAVLLLQIIVIIAFARLFGFLFKKIGQPAVIGEIVAGIILGTICHRFIFPSNKSIFVPGSFIGNAQFPQPNRFDPFHVYHRHGTGSEGHQQTGIWCGYHQSCKYHHTLYIGNGSRLFHLS
jgi:hypothetical protein